VLHLRLELNPNEEKEFTLLLGQDKSLENISALVSKYRNVDESKRALENVKDFWRNTLKTLHVKTPDTSMDIMLNYWLLYQNISCRLWARSAFYQSGGAYGFRDQLQDVLGVMHILPETARKQIILHCGHQFIEGDVQHWWHPGVCDKGIRTRFSDDLVWLPYVTSEYIEKTGDITLLYEEVNYLDDSPLREGEDERYGVPRVSNEKSNVYEHCKRAIEKALKFGEHGIPLMGSGDWNDGMNTVGNKGRGESTWLGWFIYCTLKRFSNLCMKMNDYSLAERYISIAEGISKHLEKNAWDGEWYRRAYFDDGTPLGSSMNSECKIDSLAQSWAVISGAGNKERVLTAMKSLDNYLVDRNNGLILLFTPPFDQGELHPGYIKGYVPGVRENGGQYTHAATWVIYAYAKLGFGDKAHELFHLINPVNHTKTHMECLRYKVEPYVISADVYAIEPHTGRGGWTWYTGSAGWMYNAGIEQILGFNKKADKIVFDPSIPADWKEYNIRYRYNEAIYNITVRNPNGVNKGVKRIVVDGFESEGNVLQLVNNAGEHNVDVIMG
jgi:cellobiose phosphorylase